MAKRIAAEKNWSFERLRGDLGWLRRLLDGEWNEREFLTVQPGERVIRMPDEFFIGAEPV
jgi:hypothetical protein